MVKMYVCLKVSLDVKYFVYEINGKTTVVSLITVARTIIPINFHQP